MKLSSLKPLFVVIALLFIYIAWRYPKAIDFT